MESGFVKQARKLFCKAAAESDRLSRITDDEQEPYKSKYAAREILKDAQEDICALIQSRQEENTENDETVQFVQDYVARIDRRIGINLVHTEENADGKTRLYKCVERLEGRFYTVYTPAVQQLIQACPKDDSGDYTLSQNASAWLMAYLAIAIDIMDAHNFLTMLWSGWDNHKRALTNLRRCKHSYLTTLRTVKLALPLYDGRVDAELVSNMAPTQAKLFQRTRPALITIESLYTHAQFYFAQIYGFLGKPQVASKYVENTLQRQLHYQLGELSVVEESGQGAPTEAAVEAYYASASHTNLESSESIDKQVESDEFLADIVGTGQVESLDAIEWSKNSMRLSVFYSNFKQFTYAAHCLKAAEILLGKERSRRVQIMEKNPQGTSEDSSPIDLLADEDFMRAEAELHGNWAKLLLSVMQHAYERDLGEIIGRRLIEREAEQPSSTFLPEFSFSSAERTKRIHELILSLIEQAKTSSSTQEDTTENALAEAESEDEMDGTNPWTAVHSDTAPFVNFIRTYAVESEGIQVNSDSVPVVRITLPDNLQSFDDAREIFKSASRHIQSALNFFIIDGFVTEHVALLDDLSKLYKYLAFWETDAKRKQAMQNRRVALLGPMLDVLNPAMYITSHKEISFELGQASQEALDLRIHRVEETIQREGAQAVKASELRGINTQADLTIGFYNHFLRCFEDPRLRTSDISAEEETKSSQAIPKMPSVPQSTIPPTVHACTNSSVATARYDSGDYVRGDLSAPLSGATALNDETVEAYLTAHFCIARVLNKRVDRTTRERDMIDSLHRGQWVCEAAPALIPSSNPTMFQEELRLMREHSQLLRQAIDQMRFRNTTMNR